MVLNDKNTLTIKQNNLIDLFICRTHPFIKKKKKTNKHPPSSLFLLFHPATTSSHLLHNMLAHTLIQSKSHFYKSILKSTSLIM
ncbi:hypothetical protein Hanom_Chr14g01286501 [Helianthus anomalus]